MHENNSITIITWCSSTTVARSELTRQFYHNRIIDECKAFIQRRDGGFYYALKTASNSQTNNNGLVYGRVSILGTLDNQKCLHVLVTDRAEFGVVLRAERY